MASGVGKQGSGELESADQAKRTRYWDDGSVISGGGELSPISIHALNMCARDTESLASGWSPAVALGPPEQMNVRSLFNLGYTRAREILVGDAPPVFVRADVVGEHAHLREIGAVHTSIAGVGAARRVES